ncbi:hypothetical protein BC939DRAFT_318974 [Gamsiella multidivaricata]|uniref:uncharacterized protein n=1 Tax=Gamsiella multidivaricata TaxID=101098 RepID=UPI00222123AD|nr:uncharacterized protein BC939DRAFT_318974 [Gamsiella multidivaricata]KAI7817618.1 hypothetical protein BC939DRAFT_318974 [Gamsiella multidivaricata]
MMTAYEGPRKLTLGENPVIIKFKCAGTNLRVSIAQVPTFNELCFMVQRLFRSALSSNLDNLILRYEDEGKGSNPLCWSPFFFCVSAVLSFSMSDSLTCSNPNARCTPLLDGDLVTIQDDADITHAVLLSPLLKLTVNDKVTHPVVLPIEHLPKTLGGMDEKQTIAAVTAALIDLQERIGRAVLVIQSQHPAAAAAALFNGNGGDTASTTNSRAGGRQQESANTGHKAAQDRGFTALDSTPLVLSVESLDQLLAPRKSLVQQTSVSSQASHQNALSPSTVNQAATQPTTLTNIGSQLQQQPQQQQQPQPQPQPQPQQQYQQQQQNMASMSSQPWTPQPNQESSTMQQQQPSPAPTGVPGSSFPQQCNQQYPPQQQQQQHQQAMPFGQYTASNVPQQQQQQAQAQFQAGQVQTQGQRQALPQEQQQQQQYMTQNQGYQQAQQPLPGHAVQVPPQQQQLTQSQQAPYMQIAYSPSLSVQQPRFSNHGAYSPAATVATSGGSTPFVRNSSLYMSQQQQQ